MSSASVDRTKQSIINQIFGKLAQSASPLRESPSPRPVTKLSMSTPMERCPTSPQNAELIAPGSTSVPSSPCVSRSPSPRPGPSRSRSPSPRPGPSRSRSPSPRPGPSRRNHRSPRPGPSRRGRGSSRRSPLTIEKYINRRAPATYSNRNYYARFGIITNRTRGTPYRRLPGKVCRILFDKCQQRDPQTKRFRKRDVDGSEDKPYAINFYVDKKSRLSPNR